MDQNQQTLSRAQKLNLVLENKQNRSYFVGAVSFLFFLVFIIFGLLPAFGNVLSANSENKKIKEAIKDITLRRDILLAMKTERGEKTIVLDLLESAIPNTDDQGKVIEELYALSGYSSSTDIESLDLLISQIAFLNQTRKIPLQAEYKVGLNIKSSEVAIVAEGTLSKIREFINGIENGTRVMNIKRSVINKKTGEVLNQAESEREYVLNLTIEYFYWGLPGEF